MYCNDFSHKYSLRNTLLASELPTYFNSKIMSTTLYMLLIDFGYTCNIYIPLRWCLIIYEKITCSFKGSSLCGCGSRTMRSSAGTGLAGAEQQGKRRLVRQQCAACSGVHRFQVRTSYNFSLECTTPKISSFNRSIYSCVFLSGPARGMKLTIRWDYPMFCEMLLACPLAGLLLLEW